MIIWLTAAAGLGILAAAIAYAKGRPPLLWGVGGTFLGIVVVPYLLLTKDRRDERGWRPERFGLPSRGSSCPHCGARADAEAVVCRVCRKSLISYSPADAPASGDRKAAQDGQDDRTAPREAKAAAAAAKPAARTTEEASRDPMFRRLDDAFARITVEMRRPAAEKGGEGAASDPTRTDGKVAAARRQAEAEHPVEAGRQAEAERQAEVERQIAERQAEAERQAAARRQAEAERQAEVERQATERQAEAERQAAARREAEAERQAEARRQAEAEWRAEAERAEATQPPASEEMRLERHPAQQREDERDDEREEPRFDRLGPREGGTDDGEGWVDPGDDGVSIEPRMGKGDPRLAGAWREGRPGFPSVTQGRERKPWGRRVSLALVGVLAVMVVLLAPHTGDWISRLSPPPSASSMADIANAPTPAGEPTNEWKTASGEPDTGEPAVVEPSSPASGPAAGTGAGDDPADRPSQADRPADGAKAQGREDIAAALTPPPKSPPQASPSARPAPAAPEKFAAATTSAPRASRAADRPAAPRREAAEAPLPEDFATAVRRALSEHRGRGQSSVLGPLEVTGITAAGEIVILVQQQLRERGYDPGSVDGRAGPRTRTAIEKFQRDSGRTADGEISVTLLQHLGILGRQIHAFGGETAPTMTP